ncbi:MEMBRANE-ASSOCIATED KINASE REGULATOR 6 [Hibiscus trionum]|uniref:MEMBRANE-ASSOCIATED KINASE REGULATOR 6 n=1 Tax=Hibiscus trionum TaxID=183268 RepID=A0A9W7JI75_HIBTR|nr:MEMBRANE-ASSOCIATED KINASE REGULATOR 6 [Hibiscus trionum]
MEIAESISIESFSYSWLVNLTPSLDTSLNETASFIEMDPTFFQNPQDFNKFNFPTSQTPPLTLAHADELFADGYIVPFFANHSTPTRPQASSQRDQIPDSGTKRRGRCFRKCRTRTRLSRKMVLKYLDFLRSLFSRIRGFKSCSKPEKPSPRANDPWRKSFDSESSIYEAVLHCKQSIGMLNLFYFIFCCQPF